MSVEAKAAKAIRITSAAVFLSSAGTLLAKEVIRRREERHLFEVRAQAAGDGNYVTTPQEVQLRPRLR